MLLDENVKGNRRKGQNVMLFRIIQLKPRELVIYVNANDINGAVQEAAKDFGVPPERISNPSFYSVKPVGGEDLPFV